MEPKNSRARLDANNRYIKKNMEIVTFRAQKTERLNDLISHAAHLRGISKAQYMLDAIRARLDADGVTIDTLPPDDT